MRYTLMFLGFLACTAGVAQAQPASPPLTGFDFTASIGLFSADRSETPGDSSWSGSFFKGVSAGYYWTDHLKTEVEFGFDVHGGEPEDAYQFELAVFDPYSNASLSRKLSIPRKGKEESMPFPNGAQFSAPEIAAQLLDPETQKPVVVTTRDSLKLEALIKSRETDPFKAWVYNSPVGDHEATPDKIYFADSQGDSKLKIATSVPLRKGINLLTVVTNDKNGLESRQNIVVRRE